jgi:hypothetical protein
MDMRERERINLANLPARLYIINWVRERQNVRIRKKNVGEDGQEVSGR